MLRYISRTNSIRYSVDDLRTVLRGIDVHTEWPLTKGHVHHVDDCFRDIGNVSVSRRSSGETLHDVVAEVRVRAVVVLSLTCLVCRRTGMREVVGAGGEGAGTMMEVSIPQRFSSAA